jgi:hypothetical protein
MTQPLTELVEQFCNFQRKQRGKTEGGVKTYRWNLEQFLVFVRSRDGQLRLRWRSLRALFKSPPEDGRWTQKDEHAQDKAGNEGSWCGYHALPLGKRAVTRQSTLSRSPSSARVCS